MHGTHVQEQAELLDNKPLLLREDVATEAYPARLVKLCLVTEFSKDALHRDRAIQYFDDRVPPCLDRADQDLACEFRVDSECLKLGTNRRAVPHLQRQFHDLQQ